MNERTYLILFSSLHELLWYILLIIYIFVYYCTQDNMHKLYLYRILSLQNYFYNSYYLV